MSFGAVRPYTRYITAPMSSTNALAPQAAPAMIVFELEAIAGDGGGGEASATEDSFSARSPELDAQGCGTKHGCVAFGAGADEMHTEGLRIAPSLLTHLTLRMAMPAPQAVEHAPHVPTPHEAEVAGHCATVHG